MCGILGVFNFKNKIDYYDINFSKALERLSRRGPDHKGHWLSERGNIIFGHTRLSIRDLSSNSNQPKMSKCKRFVMTYNGEVYFLEKLINKLKNKINVNSLNLNSDTEVLLESFSNFGVNDTLKTIDGMFSLALYDQKKNKVYLARDKFGEKPLYYGIVSNNFVFSSELKSLRVLSNFENKFNKTALDSYLRLSYVPTPETIYNNIYKLYPGTILEISDYDIDTLYNINKVEKYSSKKINMIKFFDPSLTINSLKNSKINDFDTALVETEKTIENSVISQKVSDVPIGCFLSGGIDSTIVTTLLKKNYDSVNTFTIGFRDKKYDEATYAKKIAKNIGTKHNELYLTHKDALNLIPDLQDAYSEPFADSSQIPTMLLSKFVSENGIKVALTGDGGDELFGGYNKYYYINKLTYINNLLPIKLRIIFSKILQSMTFLLSQNYVNKLFYFLQKNPNSLFSANLGYKIGKFSKILSQNDSNNQIFINFVNNIPLEKEIIKEVKPTIKSWLKKYDKSSNNLNIIEQYMLFDTYTYMSDDILHKVDRASMYYGLETRVPFLNTEVFKNSWRLPINFKIKNNDKKIILKNILYKYYDKDLIDRPKAGFGAPIAEWLRGSLKDWSLDLINSSSNINEIDTSYYLKMYDNHLKGYDHSQLLWVFINFLSWQKKYEC